MDLLSFYEYLKEKILIMIIVCSMRKILNCSLAGLFTDNLLGQPDPALIYDGQECYHVYEKHANTQESIGDTFVIDYSNCGFMRGEVPNPDVLVKATV